MKEVALPTKINYEEVDPIQGKIVIEPCYPGYGMTIGNALRRVLLSSLPGAAVTSVKIKGVTHEFSSIPNVKEDIVDILLNIKTLRVQLFEADSSTVYIKAKGEKKVTAKDIEAKSDVKIINSDLHIATLTDKNAELEIEMIVEKGLGYYPVEMREKEKLETGAIAIDAMFGPITKVRFNIENVRVEQMTNFDRLTLEIETDGTISPQDAFSQACEALVSHFSLFLDSLKNTDPKKAATTAKIKEKKKEEDAPDTPEDEEGIGKEDQEEEKGSKK